jgi:hypothetical protein
VTKRANGDIRRLSEQAVNYQAVKQHVQNHTIHELQFYPEHDKRRETEEYKAVHHRLVVELDPPCLVCGVRHSTLKFEAENPYGAKQMETHHHIVEWALQNAVDLAKFNKILRPHLAVRRLHRAEYATDFSEEQVQAWVDHSEDNLWVLCDVHHRAKYLGIHELTYPIWSPMNLLRDDFEAWVKDEINRIRHQG